MKRTSSSELRMLLDDLGVRPGDKLCVHAFLPSLGVVRGGAAEVMDAIFETIGAEGTLVVPTFTASYRRGEIYDVNESKSFNGAFSEYVRQRPQSVRSLCPLFSMAAIGPDAGTLMQRRSKRCFGRNSVFENLLTNDVKFVGFGVDWDQGYTFFMHLESLAGVPYRRDEAFYGLTRTADGQYIRDEAIHFVRNEEMPWKRSRRPVCEDLVKKGVIREVTIAGCRHRLFPSSGIAQSVLEYLANDIWCMTERPTCAGNNR